MTLFKKPLINTISMNLIFMLLLDAKASLMFLLKAMGIRV